MRCKYNFETLLLGQFRTPGICSWNRKIKECFMKTYWDTSEVFNYIRLTNGKRWTLSHKPELWALCTPSSYNCPTCVSIAVTSSTIRFITARTFRGSIVFSQSRVSTLLRIICIEGTDKLRQNLGDGEATREGGGRRCRSLIQLRYNFKGIARLAICGFTLPPSLYPFNPRHVW